MTLYTVDNLIIHKLPYMDLQCDLSDPLKSCMRACKIVSWLYPVYVGADARKEFLLLRSVDGELQFDGK